MENLIDMMFNAESMNTVSNNKVATGYKRKFRCFYIGRDGNTPVSRVLEVERLQHPAFTENGVTAWMYLEDCDGRKYAKLFAQLTDDICFWMNTTGLDSGDTAYITGEMPAPTETQRPMYEFMEKRILTDTLPRIAQRMNRTRLLAGELYPNRGIIAAFAAAGMNTEAKQLAAQREAIIAQREAEDQARRAAAEEAERKRKEEEAAEIARQIAEEEKSLRTKGTISGWGVVQLCDREGISIHLRTRHNLLEVVKEFINSGHSARYNAIPGKRAPRLDGCFDTLDLLKQKLGIQNA